MTAFTTLRLSFQRGVYALPVAACAGLALFATDARAQVVYLTATMDGAQETPQNASTATGFGSLVLDQTTHQMTYHVEFSGLSSAETLAHIHGLAIPGQSAPPIFDIPLGSPATGVVTTTPTLELSIIAGLTYINVHSVNFPNGEIRGQILVAPVHVPFCFGDGIVQTCPCGNDNPGGNMEGCLNSLGFGAHLEATGFASLSQDSLTLRATQMPNSFALYIQGTAHDNGGFGSVFGDGLNCVTGTVMHIAIRQNINGESQYPNQSEAAINSLGQVTSVGKRSYHVIYRNPASFCTSGTFNTTNAVEVTWVP